MSNNQCQFEASTQTSSATICKWCGQEKSQHNKQMNNNITLLEAAKPLIKYLNDNYHPMCTAIVTLTNVEILEGIECDNTDEFIKD